MAIANRTLVSRSADTGPTGLRLSAQRKTENEVKPSTPDSNTRRFMTPKIDHSAGPRVARGPSRDDRRAAAAQCPHACWPFAFARNAWR